MKSFVTIFAAAVLSGLGVYLAFEACSAFALLSNQVVCNITVFVLMIAALTVTSAALSLLLRGAIHRTDRNLIGKLEDRLRALEQGSPQLGSPPKLQ